MYIDGDLVNSGSSALNYNLNAGFPTRINGGYHCQGGTQCRFMTCVLADIQVSLSVKYESTFSPDCQITTASDAILHYSFNDMSSGVATDLSGSGNNGVIYGAYSSEEEPECVCSDTLACNYNDEEPCHYECHYCLAGTVWDEELQGCVPDNPSDLNHDGCVDVNDFMGHLAAFGGGCDGNPQTSIWQCGDPLEYQGYDYETVQIGEQCWFAENLRNENYQNGDSIPSGLSNSEWINTTSGAVAVYGESVGCENYSPDIDACDPSQSLNEYGRLYNYYAVVDPRKLCPQFWHVGNTTDFSELIEFLGGTEFAGELMRASSGWYECVGCSGNGNNQSGFNGKPGGGRSEHTGHFGYAGLSSLWWVGSINHSSPDAFYHGMDGNSGTGVFGFPGNPSGGISVRCVQDTE